MVWGHSASVGVIPGFTMGGAAAAAAARVGLHHPCLCHGSLCREKVGPQNCLEPLTPRPCPEPLYIMYHLADHAGPFQTIARLPALGLLARVLFFS